MRGERSKMSNSLRRMPAREEGHEVDIELLTCRSDTPRSAVPNERLYFKSHTFGRSCETQDFGSSSLCWRPSITHLCRRCSLFEFDPSKSGGGPSGSPHGENLRRGRLRAGTNQQLEIRQSSPSRATRPPTKRPDQGLERVDELTGEGGTAMCRKQT